MAFEAAGDDGFEHQAAFAPVLAQAHALFLT